MKTWIRRMVFAVLAVLCLMGLAGCSAATTVDTTLVLNEDLSGVREMDVAIDAASFQENFHGSIADLNTVIQNNCPEQLTWSYSGDDGTDRYHVELTFETPEEYKQKVEAILDEEVTLDLAAPTTVWANGFRVNESFTSKDLLEWLTTALVENGFVDSSNESYILGDGITNVEFNQATYSTGSTVQANQMEYLPLDKIDMLTDLQDLNSFDRSVIFYIPKASMNAKKTEIETYLNSIVPEGAGAEWGTYEGGVTMTVRKTGMDIAALDAFTKQVLDSDRCTVETAESEKEPDLLTFLNTWGDELNLSSYAGNEYGTVQFNYYCQGHNGMSLESDPDYGTLAGNENGIYEGYLIYAGNRFSEFSLHGLLRKAYQVSSIQVETAVKGSDNFSSTVTIGLASVPSETEQTVISERFTEKAADLADISMTTAEDGCSIEVSAVGDGERMAEVSQQIFDAKRELIFAEEDGLLKPIHAYGFYERMYFPTLSEDTTEDFELTYTVKTGFLSSISEDNLSELLENGAERKGGNLTIHKFESSYKVAIHGNRLNPIGAAIWLAAIVLAVLCLLKLKRSGAIAALKEDAAQARAAKAAAQAAAQATVGQAAAGQATAGQSAGVQTAAQPAAQTADIPQSASVTGTEQSVNVQQPKPETVPQPKKMRPASVVFCEDCGQANEKGAVFCENCGARLSN